VFLALGLGLLLGGTLGEELIVKEQGQLLNRLEERYTQTKADNTKLQKQSSDWQQRAEQLEQVTAQVGGHYARERLVGKKIAILQLEQANLSPLLSTLEQAGANVTLTVQGVELHSLLQDEARLQALKERMNLDARADASATGSKLAETIVDELFFQSNASVLNFLKGNQSLSISGTPGLRPDHIIVVGGTTAQSEARIKQFDMPLLTELIDRHFHVVGTERSDVEKSGMPSYQELGISTVDNIDQVSGRVALVDILGGAKGHYGTKKSADAILPEAPTAKEVSTQ
jgi:hypothetical protein